VITFVAPFVIGFILRIVFIDEYSNTHDVAIREQLKIRQKGLNNDAVTKYERCGTNPTDDEIRVSVQVS
jgi:hypothetical protein